MAPDIAGQSRADHAGRPRSRDRMAASPAPPLVGTIVEHRADRRADLVLSRFPMRSDDAGDDRISRQVNSSTRARPGTPPPGSGRCAANRDRLGSTLVRAVRKATTRTVSGSLSGDARRPAPCRFRNGSSGFPPAPAHAQDSPRISAWNTVSSFSLDIGKGSRTADSGATINRQPPHQGPG